MKNIIKKLLSFLPTLNIIVFESVPNLSDNPKPLFDELIGRGFNKKYKFVWIVSGEAKDLPVIKNVYYCNKNSKTFKYRFLFYRLFAKAMICGNEFLVTLRKKQTSFYISHGTAIKSVKSYYTMPENIDYFLVDGEGTKEMMAYQFNVLPEKTIALGYPRNDALVNVKRDISQFFPENKGEKIVVWYPTFRQHKNTLLNATHNALPIIHDEEQAIKLNEIAKANNVVLVLKPHFAQDISKFQAQSLSNIKFIDDSFFTKNSISSYEFVGNCDALITDYSSIYFDFLLCDKPIGLVWEDYEEYKESVNFAIDMDTLMNGGEKIYNLDDFSEFLSNIANGIDLLKKERKEVSLWANYSHDGKSSQRVADFIIEKTRL